MQIQTTADYEAHKALTAQRVMGARGDLTSAKANDIRGGRFVRS